LIVVSYVLMYIQIMAVRPERVEQELAAPIRLLPMLAGSLVEQYVTCGKPGCRCSRGQKHGPLYYLYWKEKGRSRSLYVPREKVDELRQQVQNYRRFQKELAELLQRQLRDWQQRLQEERRQ
jgi:hypothetical protein